MKKNHSYDEMLFIAWERHRRAVTLTSKLGINVSFFESRRSRLIKFPWFSVQTLLLLIRVKPKILFVQNPSLILCCLVSAVKPFFRFCLIVDAHNIGVIWYGDYEWFFQPILNYLHRISNITIVTNDSLAKIILGNRGVPFVLPDAVPDDVYNFNNGILEPEHDFFKVIYICTFSDDEPYKSVFEAAKLLPDDTKIFVTGRVEKIGGASQFDCDCNLIFKGFLTDRNYWKLMSEVHCVVDLTTRDDCLVCGAYEAVAMGIPMVLSDNKETRFLFNKGAVYAQNNAKDIASAILEVKKRFFNLSREVNELYVEMNKKWQKQNERLQVMIRKNCLYLRTDRFKREKKPS